MHINETLKYQATNQFDKATWFSSFWFARVMVTRVHTVVRMYLVVDNIWGHLQVFYAKTLTSIKAAMLVVYICQVRSGQI